MIKEIELYIFVSMQISNMEINNVYSPSNGVGKSGNHTGLSFGEWSPWSPCSVTCGDGIRTRSRECKSGCPTIDNNDDSQILNEEEKCNQSGCKSIVKNNLSVIVFMEQKSFIFMNFQYIYE